MAFTVYVTIPRYQPGVSEAVFRYKFLLELTYTLIMGIAKGLLFSRIEFFTVAVPNSGVASRVS